jgi:hypothetical protein
MYGWQAGSSYAKARRTERNEQWSFEGMNLMIVLD